MARNDSITPFAMASYAMIKSLTDSKEYKNQYEILAEFIKFIIAEKGIITFTADDMRRDLRQSFGFDIPSAVVKTAVKKIPEIERANKQYTFSSGILPQTEEFVILRQEARDKSSSLIHKLLEFASAKMPDRKIDREELERAFITYLVDDINDNKYSDVISHFIISEDSSSVKEQISAVREGSILYCGLCYNMSEIGSINKNLTLFLDTEILFDIAGYNGTLYQQMAMDLIAQVNAANRKKRMIALRYFEDVEHEIDNFFTTAEGLLERNSMLNNNSAMTAILSGCKTVSDIREEQHELFDSLRRNYGIMPDQGTDYYSAKYNSYNLEDKNVPEGFEDDENTREAVKFISHINKLRSGNITEDYTACGYLIISETRTLLELSQIMTQSGKCSFALPMSTITNILWFKLGNGFGGHPLPVNADISYKAKRIIAGEIVNSVNIIYRDVMDKYRAGEIKDDEFAARIIFLRNKTHFPDAINSGNIDEITDFSPERIQGYELAVRNNNAILKEKDDIIAKQNTEISEKDAEISRQNIELAEYRRIRKYVFVIFIIIVTAGLTAGFVYLSNILPPCIVAPLGVISSVITIAGVIPSVRKKLKDYWRKLF